MSYAISVGSSRPEDKTLAYIIGWAVVLGLVFLLGVAVETGRPTSGAGDDRCRVESRAGGGRHLQHFQATRVDAGPAGSRGLAGHERRVLHLRRRTRGLRFLALLVSPQVYSIGGREYKIVIVPTAPVPFGGGLLFVPIECVQAADMSVDGLMSIYVSMGVTASQFMQHSIKASEAK